MWYMGVDPGNSGGVAFIFRDRSQYFAWAVKDMSLTDIVQELEIAMRLYDIRMCYIEAVHSMPAQGVVSSFTFGQSYGQMLGILAALRIPYKFVRPIEWQTAHRCRTGGDKNVSKAAAQRIFTKMKKITHATADALLIADYCRMKEM